jgi:hypothetical protein
VRAFYEKKNSLTEAQRGHQLQQRLIFGSQPPSWGGSESTGSYGTASFASVPWPPPATLGVTPLGAFMAPPRTPAATDARNGEAMDVDSSASDATSEGSSRLGLARPPGMRSSVVAASGTTGPLALPPVPFPVPAGVAAARDPSPLPFGTQLRPPGLAPPGAPLGMTGASAAQTSDPASSSSASYSLARSETPAPFPPSGPVPPVAGAPLAVAMSDPRAVSSMAAASSVANAAAPPAAAAAPMPVDAASGDKEGDAKGAFTSAMDDAIREFVAASKTQRKIAWRSLASRPEFVLVTSEQVSVLALAAAVYATNGSRLARAM